jgi:hypothetical protein
MTYIRIKPVRICKECHRLANLVHGTGLCWSCRDRQNRANSKASPQADKLKAQKQA